MLVTCPECNEKISEHAHPCPRCGSPYAGLSSREHCEQVAKAATGKTYREESWCSCGPNRGLKVIEKDKLKVRGELVASTTHAGWQVRLVANCPNCNKELVVESFYHDGMSVL
jgi:hypothetical protein